MRTLTENQTLNNISIYFLLVIKNLSLYIKIKTFGEKENSVLPSISFHPNPRIQPHEQEVAD